MTRIDPLRRRTLGGLIGLPALATFAGCASTASMPPPPGADPLPTPQLRPGGRWRYRLLNRYNGTTITNAVAEVLAASPELRVRVDLGEGRPSLLERYASPWVAIEESVFDTPIFFESPMPVVPAGLGAGQSLRSSARYRSPVAPFALAWQQTLTARGWERVAVPAGEFDALRVERLIWFQHPDTFRNASERTDVLWYAPQVGRWVRREWTGSYHEAGGLGRGARFREDWIVWELTGWEPAAR